MNFAPKAHARKKVPTLRIALKPPVLCVKFGTFYGRHILFDACSLLFVLSLQSPSLFLAFSLGRLSRAGLRLTKCLHAVRLLYEHVHNMTVHDMAASIRTSAQLARPLHGRPQDADTCYPVCGGSVDTTLRGPLIAATAQRVAVTLPPPTLFIVI